MGVPATGYQQPVLLLQGGADTVQPAPTTLLLQQQLQQGGADSHLRFYPAATHFTLLPEARSETAALRATTRREALVGRRHPTERRRLR
jgi:pimeloyl-ACP methyl ester carboxylesterase